MNTISNVPLHKASRANSFIVLILAIFGYTLLSPKWLVPLIAWIAPASLLYFFRYAPFKFKFLWLFLVLYTTNIVANYEVAPLPLPILVVVTIIGTALNIIPFLLDKWVSKHTNHFAGTLVFPAAFVAKEFFDSLGGGGVWSSIANTQYSFKWLVQLASVTGLWGISFLIFWFATAAVWVISQQHQKAKFKRAITLYGTVMLIVLLFGGIRYSPANKNIPGTKVAGVTVSLFPFMEALYKDAFKKEIHINPKISQSSPELQQVNMALIPFIENPDTIKFGNGFHALHTIYDSLFALSTKAVSEGAKIITWSEANAFVIKNDEPELLKRGSVFAKNNKVYLLMALGTIEPGKITEGKNFIENKAVLFAPDGSMLNDFRKNHPVPFAEHSAPGDGKIPVLETPYGKISSSICYDADFPQSMQQLSKNKTGLLLLPSSDWHAISPYHSYIAVFRAIENGSSVIRQAAGGLSLVSDYRGKIIAHKNFFDEGEKLMIANVPIEHVTTIYSVIGDSFAFICIVFIIIIGIILIVKTIKTRKVKN